MSKKRRLKNAPLILTHLEVSYSELPDEKVFSSEELKAFHKRMLKAHLPDKLTVMQTVQELNLNQSAPSLTGRQLYRYAFRDGDGQSQVEVSADKIVIRQTAYKGFEALSKLAVEVFSAAKEVSDIADSVIELSSIHYVDIIFPSEGRQLNDYINPETVQYFKLKLPNQISSRSSINSVSLLEKSDSKIRDLSLRLDIQPIAEGGRLPRVIPRELQEHHPDLVLSLSLPATNSISDHEDYGVMDIRHATKYFKKPRFADFNFREEIGLLYQAASDVFWDSISKLAQDEWEVEEYDPTA